MSTTTEPVMNRTISEKARGLQHVASELGHSVSRLALIAIISGLHKLGIDEHNLANRVALAPVIVIGHAFNVSDQRAERRRQLQRAA